MALRPIARPDIGWIPGSVPYDGRPTTVTRLVPAGYAAYVQILHAIYVVPGKSPLEVISQHPGISEALAKVDAALAELGESLPEGVSAGRSRVWGWRAASEGRRVRWAELAPMIGSSLGTPADFDRDLRRHIPSYWPDAFDGPPDGSLTDVEWGSLVRALAPFTTGEVTCLYRWYNTKNWTGRSDQGPLTDLIDYFSMDEVEGSPEYWWPEDRAWLVHTDVDSCYSLVACARPVADALLNDPDLECLELQPGDSLAGS